MLHIDDSHFFLLIIFLCYFFLGLLIYVYGLKPIPSIPAKLASVRRRNARVCLLISLHVLNFVFVINMFVLFFLNILNCCILALTNLFFWFSFDVITRYRLNSHLVVVAPRVIFFNILKYVNLLYLTLTNLLFGLVLVPMCDQLIETTQYGCTFFIASKLIASSDHHNARGFWYPVGGFFTWFMPSWWLLFPFYFS